MVEAVADGLGEGAQIVAELAVEKVEKILAIDPEDKIPYLGFKPVGLQWGFEEDSYEYDSQTYDTATYWGTTGEDYASATWYFLDVRHSWDKPVPPANLPVVTYRVGRYYREAYTELITTEYENGSKTLIIKREGTVYNPSLKELDEIVERFHL